MLEMIIDILYILFILLCLLGVVFALPSGENEEN